MTSFNSKHPPVRQAYSAYTNQGFLLREVGLVAELLLDGASQDEVSRQVMGDNLFQLRSEASRKTILGAVHQRLDKVPPALLDFLAEGSLELKRLTNLYLILLKHRLLRELIAEVILEELRRFSYLVPTSELGSFIERKRAHVPDVGSWSDATVAKSRSNMVTVCLQADLLEETEDGFRIQPQIVPGVLRDELTTVKRAAFLKLLLDREVI